MVISIHALREEGDRRASPSARSSRHFYPRPPRGGRRSVDVLRPDTPLFLSTPSARRATHRSPEPRIRQDISIHALREEGDVRGRLDGFDAQISIHALREEGDEWRRRR